MNHPWLHVSLSTFPPTPVDTHVHEHSANNICTFFLDTTTGCKVFKLSMPASDLGLHHSLISSLGKLALFLSFLFLAPSLTPRFSVFPQKFSFSLWLTSKDTKFFFYIPSLYICLSPFLTLKFWIHLVLNRNLKQLLFCNKTFTHV